jgi:glycerol kinase
LVRPNNIETTSVGAARAARMGLLEKETEIEDEKGMRSFIPQMPKDAAEENLNRWLAAVECVNQFYGSKNP